MGNELKCCPFCGGKPVTRISFRTAPTGTIKASVNVLIRCPKCDCNRNIVLELCDTDFYKAQDAMNKATAAWNRRYEPRQGIEFDYGAED